MKFRDELTVGDFIEIQTRFPDVANLDQDTANKGSMAKANAFMMALLLDDGTPLAARERTISSMPMSRFIKIVAALAPRGDVASINEQKKSA